VTSLTIDLVWTAIAALCGASWAVVEVKTRIAEPGGTRPVDVARIVLQPHLLLLIAVIVAGAQALGVVAGSLLATSVITAAMRHFIATPPLRRVLVLSTMPDAALPRVPGLLWQRPGASSEEIAVDAVMADLMRLPKDQAWLASAALSNGIAVYDTPYLLGRLATTQRR
jgi:hypothetical protein